MKKSHWIILIVLIVLIGVYFIAKSRQPIEKELRFFTSDSVDVAKLEFITVEDTIIVSKIKNEWRMTYPLQWEVNQTQIESFFSKVFAIKTSETPMSEDPMQQKMYKVDDANAIQVKVYNNKGKVIDHVFIGNGANSDLDYGRRNGEKSIYQFKDNITVFVKPDIYQWRSPNISNIKKDQIEKIDVTYTKNAYSLTVFGDSIVYADKNESFTIPAYNRAQYKVINALENLMTWQFLDKDTEQYAKKFISPACKVVVTLKDKKTKTFTLIQIVETKKEAWDESPQTSTKILMMIDDKITPLYEMTGDFINRFTRAPQHFKAEYD
jgi:hypothetical protein